VVHHTECTGTIGILGPDRILFRAWESIEDKYHTTKNSMNAKKKASNLRKGYNVTSWPVATSLLRNQ
jgi:hypothetical protein